MQSSPLKEGVKPQAPLREVSHLCLSVFIGGKRRVGLILFQSMFEKRGALNVGLPWRTP